MKKRVDESLTSRRVYSGRKSRLILRQVTPGEVIDRLLELFEHLGIETRRDAFPISHVKQLISPHPLYTYSSAIGELLTRWHQDTSYLDSDGVPIAIKRSGRSPSFNSLSRRFVPELDEAFLLSELQALGAVSIDAGGLIHVHMRSFPAYEDKRLAIQHTLVSLDGFIRTLRHNLDSPASNADQLFHRIVQCGDFNSREIPALKIRVRRMGQNFLESFDDWLIRQSVTQRRSSNRNKKGARVSIGVYLSIDAA